MGFCISIPTPGMAPQMPPEESQETLVVQAKAGDRLALERLLISHSEVLSAHIARRLPASLRSTISVEDVTQQALLQTFLKIDLLRDTSLPAFSAWLKAIGEKTLMDMIKQHRRHKGDASALPDLLDRIEAPIRRFTADGAYDHSSVYERVAEAGTGDVTILIPPRRSAVSAGPTDGPWAGSGSSEYPEGRTTRVTVATGTSKRSDWIRSQPP